MRSRIAQTAPSVNLMKAPDTETSTSATLPNRQGRDRLLQPEHQPRPAAWLPGPGNSRHGASSAVSERNDRQKEGGKRKETYSPDRTGLPRVHKSLADLSKTDSSSLR